MAASDGIDDMGQYGGVSLEEAKAQAAVRDEDNRMAAEANAAKAKPVAAQKGKAKEGFQHAAGDPNIQLMQAFMRLLGIDSGAIDGLLGKLTKGGLDNFLAGRPDFDPGTDQNRDSRIRAKMSEEIAAKPEMTAKRLQELANSKDKNDVKAAQIALNKLGAKDEKGQPLKVDGVAGAHTKAALNKYLEEHKVAPVQTAEAAKPAAREEGPADSKKPEAAPIIDVPATMPSGNSAGTVGDLSSENYGDAGSEQAVTATQTPAPVARVEPTQTAQAASAQGGRMDDNRMDQVAQAATGPSASSAVTVGGAAGVQCPAGFTCTPVYNAASGAAAPAAGLSVTTPNVNVGQTLSREQAASVGRTNQAAVGTERANETIATGQGRVNATNARNEAAATRAQQQAVSGWINLGRQGVNFLNGLKRR